MGGISRWSIKMASWYAFVLLRRDVPTRSVVTSPGACNGNHHSLTIFRKSAASREIDKQDAWKSKTNIECFILGYFSTSFSFPIRLVSHLSFIAALPYRLLYTIMTTRLTEKLFRNCLPIYNIRSLEKKMLITKRRRRQSRIGERIAC